MKLVDFSKGIQMYYGNYENEFILRAVMKYLSEFDENNLDGLFECTLGNFSNRWGKPPDIAVFEEVIEKSFKTEHQIYRVKWGVTVQEGNGSFWNAPERQLKKSDFPIAVHFMKLLKNGAQQNKALTGEIKE